MSICVTESSQSRRMLDAMDNYQERLSKLEADLAFGFTQAIEAGEPDATPLWAGFVTDYDKARALGMAYSAPGLPQRPYTVAECLQDALDYAKGPSLSDVVKVLAMAMKSTDPVVALAARQLVERTAAKWAKANAEVGE